MVPLEKADHFERGTYYFFDVNSWRKVPKEFHLDYAKLEDRPSLPTSLTAGGGPPGSGTGQPGSQSVGRRLQLLMSSFLIGCSVDWAW